MDGSRTAEVVVVFVVGVLLDFPDCFFNRRRSRSDFCTDLCRPQKSNSEPMTEAEMPTRMEAQIKDALIFAAGSLLLSFVDDSSAASKVDGSSSAAVVLVIGNASGSAAATEEEVAFPHAGGVGAPTEGVERLGAVAVSAAGGEGAAETFTAVNNGAAPTVGWGVGRRVVGARVVSGAGAVNVAEGETATIGEELGVLVVVASSPPFSTLLLLVFAPCRRRRSEWAPPP